MVLCLLRNETADVKQCGAETIPFSEEECNTQACSESDATTSAPTGNLIEVCEEVDQEVAEEVDEEVAEDYNYHDYDYGVGTGIDLGNEDVEKEEEESGSGSGLGITESDSTETGATAMVRSPLNCCIIT